MSALTIFACLCFFLPFYLFIGLCWLRFNPEVVRLIRLNARDEVVLLIAAMFMAILWPVWSIYIGTAYVRGMLRIICEQRAVKPR
jgi:hypothetical protein